MDYSELIQNAIDAKEYAYTPYSNFRVGAALLTKSGKIYRGCNIENAAYTPTNCAERTAFFKAISEGEKEFAAIVVNGDADDYLYPCGVCRQVMVEFCDGSMPIILTRRNGDSKTVTLDELVPMAFDSMEI